MLNIEGILGGPMEELSYRYNTIQCVKLLEWFCKNKLSEFPMPPKGLLEEYVDQFAKEQSAK